MRVAWAVLVTLTAGSLVACGDDGSSAPSASVPVAEDGLGHRTTTTTLDLGDLDLEVPPGFQPIPVPEVGFGLAVPEGFQVTLLTPEALEVLEGAGVPDGGFVAAARNAADAGAILYGAGVAPDGAVTDVKLDVQPTDDPDRALLGITDEVARRPDLADVEISDASDAEPPAVRIRFTTPGPEGGGRAQGTQFLYRAADGVWSLIVTSEDPSTHDAVADAIGESFVLSATSS